MLQLERYFTGKTHVIWDWNGTLLDDLDLCHEIVCELLHENGRFPISRDEHRRLFRMPVVAFYRDLGFDFAAIPFDRLSLQFVERYRARVGRCSLFEGTAELLGVLKASGKALSVLSAAKETDLRSLLAHYGIDAFFEHVCGLKDHSADCKIARGHELISQWNVEASRTILVGDMDHDRDVAEALGIDVLLLGDGHQSFERFSNHPLHLPTRYLIEEG